MNVTDFNPVGKPDSVHGTPFESFAASTDAFVRQLQAFVREASIAGESFDSVERRVRQIVRDVGRRSLDEFVRLQGDGDLGEQVETEDKQTLYRSPKRAKTELRSIFGLHVFEQFTYAPGSKQAIALRPVSARMALPARRWSYLLQELVQMLAVDSAYEQATANVGHDPGGAILGRYNRSDQCGHGPRRR